MRSEKKSISNATREPTLRGFHQEVMRLQKTRGLNVRNEVYGRFGPNAIWNMDQVPFAFVRGNRKSYNLKNSFCWVKNQGPSGIEKRMCTIVMTLRAYGAQLVKPFILFKGRGQLSKELIAELDAEGIPYGFNEKGYSNGRSSIEYLQYFKGIVAKHEPDIKEHLLYLDNFGPQASSTFIDLAMDMDIYPVYFPPNCTHLVQPVDHRIAAWVKQFIGELYKVDQAILDDEWTRYRITKTLTDQVFRQTCLLWMATMCKHLEMMSEFILSSFLSTGCLIPLDGKHAIYFKDIREYSF